MSVDETSRGAARGGVVSQVAACVDEMGVDGERPSRIDKAVMGGPPQRVGRFEYRYDTDTWAWSDTVARMHGYQPGEVTPTTDLVLKHKHPDDLAQVRALLAQSAAPFSSRHRIITTTGETRRVVVVGDAVNDADGQVVATRGFYIDCAHRMSPGVLTEIPHLMAGSVYRLAGAGGGSAEGVCGGVVVA